MRPFSVSAAAFFVLSLLAAFGITALVRTPDYTDAYYHFTAAERLARGDGLTVPYLWTYIGAPESLAAGEAVPSHTYWMPLTSLSAAAGMAVLNAPGDVAAARWPFALMLAGAACVAYWLGRRLGGTRRHAWVAGLLMLASPFYIRWWGAIDTFAPYALVGSLALVGIGLGAERRSVRWFAFAGAMCGLCHLTRADGLVMLIAGVLVIVWPRTDLRQRGVLLAALLGAYLVVMLPWFVRSIGVTGSPLPIGGTQSIWFTTYDDLFAFPPDASPSTMFADGLGAFVESRWLGISTGLQTFVAVEGVIFLTPLMLIGLWRRRTDFTRGVWLAALGTHAAMMLIFPYPGARGGLFHSAAALMPFWMAFAACGVDDAVYWVAKRLPHWKPAVASVIFSALLVLLVWGLSAVFALDALKPKPEATLYAAVRAALPADARVMSSDPAALYAQTGLTGVVLPNEPPDSIAVLAERYDIDYVLVDGENLPLPLKSVLEAPPAFLVPLAFDADGRLYEIRR